LKVGEKNFRGTIFAFILFGPRVVDIVVIPKAIFLEADTSGQCMAAKEV
jgi:hypothetical protein